MRPVRADGDGVEFEGKARSVEFWVEVASLLGSLHGARDGADPLVHDCSNAVAHYAATAIEFKRSRSKKATSLEDSFFNENQPVVNQRPQTRHALGCCDGRERHLFYEDVARHFDGS